MSAPRHAIFISYRRVDSVYAVDQLDERLKQAFGAEAVFRDASSLEPGAIFPDHIRSAVDEARVALVVIGPWWLRASRDPNDLHSPARLDDPADWVRIEIETLLGRGDGVSVIPLLLGGANLPMETDLPATLQALPSRNGMTLRPFPDFEGGVGQVIAAVAKLLKVTPTPMPPRHDPGHHEPPPRVASPRLSVTGRHFVGRQPELLLLDEAWGRSAKDKINIVSLIGQGGEGKTALMIEWTSRRARFGWAGVRRVFDWSFYSQGTSAQSSASADEFFNAAFAWFDKSVEVPKDAWTKGAKLAELVAAERTLLVLDGLEPLQQPPGDYGGEFKDPAMKALLRGLALHNPGLCLLTSRTDITDLSSYEHGKGACQRHPLHALDPVAARALLRELRVLGPDKELDEAINWFHRHAYDLNLLGNYLAKCTPDHDIRGWQQKFPIMKEDERIHPVPDKTGKRAGHGRRMLRAYERWLGPDSPATSILRLLGLFDRPVRSDLLDELRASPVIPNLTAALVPLPNDEWLRTVDQLEQLALITREPVEGNDPGSRSRKTSVRTLASSAMTDTTAKRPRRPVSYTLDCHPLLREHFAAELREQHPDARRKGHKRLYKYLCETTPDKPAATLEDLQPLYQAVAHGCHAEMQQEACDNVYYARILRGGEAYSTKRLGASGADLGAIACFFETPWSRVSPMLTEDDQAWLLNEAAFRLRALGRLTEALEPMRANLKMRVEREEWKHAPSSASNLSEMELTLGEVTGAVGDAEQSVTYADRSGEWDQRMINRTTHADALHQAGRRAEAETLFREAEALQAQSQPDYTLLYSLQGFRYCDLLLAEAERAAWQSSPHAPREESRTSPGVEDSQTVPQTIDAGSQIGLSHAERAGYLATCRTISERAAQLLKWDTPSGRLLDFGLHHLTLSRAVFYAVMLGPAELPVGPHLTEAVPRVPTAGELATARRELDAAVSGLRRAGTSHMLPLGLLTRAWLRFVEGNRTGSGSAQSDLDEAWEIAERGSMKLHMADVLLYRARLFGGRKAEGGAGSEEGEKYPWGSAAADLAAAGTLINTCGYHRRDGELADAKAALL